MNKKVLFMFAVLITAVLCFGIGASAQTSDTVESLTAQIQALQERLAQLQSGQKDSTPPANTGTGSAASTQAGGWCHTFNQYLKMGDTDATTNGEISQLVVALAQNGILLNEATKTVFNPDVKNGVIRFQRKYSIAQIGTVGPQTREKLNQLYGCGIVKVTHPNGAGNLRQGQEIIINWTSSRLLETDKVNLWLDNDADIDTQGNGGSSGMIVVNLPGTTKSHTFTLPNNQAGTKFKVKIEVFRDQVLVASDKSDNYFRITGDNCKYDGADGVNIGNVYKPTKAACMNAWDSFGESRPGSKVYYNGTPIYTYGSNCAPIWNCGAWSVCISGQQTRTCTDSNACGSDAYKPALNQSCLSNQPTITVTSPNGGETWKVGETYNITWTSAGVDKVTIWLAKEGATDVTELITGSSQISASAGRYAWVVPTNNNDINLGGRFKVVVGNADLANQYVRDSSDNYFTIAAAGTTTYCQQLSNKITTGMLKSCGMAGYDKAADIVQGNGSSPDPDGRIDYSDLAIYATHQTNESWCQAQLNTTTNPCAPTTPAITVTSPNGGESFTTGRTYTIRWNSSNIPSTENVKIELAYTHTDPTYPGGTRVEDWLIEKTPNAGSYLWTVPEWYGLGLDEDAFNVKISHGSAVDYSDQRFTIKMGTSNPNLTLTQGPTAGTTYNNGDKIYIKWAPYDNQAAYSATLLKKSDTSFARWLALYPDYNNPGLNYWTVLSGLTGTDYYIRVETSRTATRTNIGYSSVFGISNSIVPSIPVKSIFLDESNNVHFIFSQIASACLQLKDSQGNYFSLKSAYPNYSCVNSTLFTGYKTELLVPRDFFAKTITVGGSYQVCNADTRGNSFATCSSPIVVSGSPIRITDVKFTPASPKVNEWITADVTIYNDSSADYNIPFKVDVSGYTLPVNSLAAKSSQTMRFSNAFTFQTAGTYTIYTSAIYPIPENTQTGSVGDKLAKSLTFTALTTPAITVTSPNGGETWRIGERPNITWTSSNITKVNINITNTTNNYSLNISQEYPDSSKSFSWTVPSNLPNLVPGNQYKITIYDATNSNSSDNVNDSSDNYFTIAAAGTTPSITLYSPNGGEIWKPGETRNVIWSATGIPSSDVVDIVLVGKQNVGSSNYMLNIATNIPVLSSPYVWTIPSTVPGLSDNYKIIITDNSRTNYATDTSNNYFTINATTAACTDSDGGLAYYIRGTVVGPAASGYVSTATDSCWGNIVTEGRCLNGVNTYVDYTCPNGCDNGACKTATTQSSITVARDASSPVAQNVQPGQNVTLAKFKFTNTTTSTTALSSISQIKMRLVGTIGSIGVDSVKLTQGATTLATVPVYPDGSINFTELSIPVAGNTFIVLGVDATISPAALFGRTIGISINSASDVSISGAEATVNGGFPVSGSLMNVGATTTFYAPQDQLASITAALSELARLIGLLK